MMLLTQNWKKEQNLKTEFRKKITTLTTTTTTISIFSMRNYWTSETRIPMFSDRWKISNPDWSSSDKTQTEMNSKLSKIRSFSPDRNKSWWQPVRPVIQLWRHRHLERHFFRHLPTFLAGAQLKLTFCNRVNNKIKVKFNRAATATVLKSRTERELFLDDKRENQDVFCDDVLMLFKFWLINFKISYIFFSKFLISKVNEHWIHHCWITCGPKSTIVVNKSKYVI